MERISELSKVQVAQATAAVSVDNTIVAARGYHEIKVPATTSLETCLASRCYQFTVNPVLPDEVNVDNCNLNITMKILKNDKAYAASDQISMIQAAPLNMWEYMRIMVIMGNNGK